MSEEATSCKALMKKVLSGGPLPLKKLRKKVVAELVASGKSADKAAALFAAKLELPCFMQGADKQVSLVKQKAAAPAEEGSSSSAKRKASDLADSGTKKVKQPKAAAAAPGAPTASAVKMMPAAEATTFRRDNRIELTGRDAVSFRPVATFADAGFAPDALHACKAFARPTPIQAECWPIISGGRDMIGVAETGSGKTLAFFLPAVAYAARAKAAGRGGVLVLVLAPTRELAMQTEVVCNSAGAGCGLKSICIYGGVPKPPQIAAVRGGAAVVVATPGRLLDLHSEGAVPLENVCYLVLDEADRMLDMGFEKDVRNIISLTPPSRRTVMFTATWPDSVRTLAAEFLNDALRVNVGSEALSANHRVTQHVEVVDQDAKERRLFDLLGRYKPSSEMRILVFALYKKEAARVEQTLQRRGFHSIAIHGDQTQAARTSALEQFKAGKVPLLVATDVAARGLDIPLVQVVINYTFPLTIEDYVHRIGRTGRGGKTGISHTFFTNFDKAHAGGLQNILREAGQEVPDDLMRFGSAVKKKEHKMYGSFGPAEGGPMKAATRIVFD